VLGRGQAQRVPSAIQQLVELGSGSCEASALEDVGAFVFVTTPTSDAEVLGRFAVTGCSTARARSSRRVSRWAER